MVIRTSSVFRQIHLSRAAALAVLALTAPLAILPAHAAAPATADAATSGGEHWQLLAPMKVVHLQNGMTFLIYPNKRAPIFSGVVRFDVGGKNELPGETGIAHMFEHMAFKGTQHIGTTDWPAEKKALAKVETAAEAFDTAREKLIDADTSPSVMQTDLAPEQQALAAAQRDAEQYVVPNEYDQIYQREGATDLNAQTSADATTYFLSLPANRIDLWMKMESERLIDPVMREFYSERNVVMEERRMRNDNDPQGKLWELMLGMALTASPYGHPTIGWASDIRNLTATEAHQFFESHYTPDRGIGVLVGDLDVAKTEAMLRETFGKIPARKDAEAIQRTVPEPPQQGERRAILRLDAQPTLMMGWHKPNLPDIDDVRAEALEEVLTGGRSARWFERLVKQQKTAADIAAFTGPGDALPNLFMIFGTPQGATTLDELEKAIREQVADLREKPVGADELEAAKKRLRANTIRSLESNLGLAQHLAETAQLSGDPYYLERRLHQLEAVTPADLQAFAKKYLVDTNLTVVRLEPPEGAKQADAATSATANE